MRWIYIYWTIILVFLSGCGLLTNWRDGVDETIYPQSNSNSFSMLQEAALSQIGVLLFPDSDCHLPCFGSLYPGQSTTEAVEEFVGEFNANEPSVRVQPHESGGFSISLFVDPTGLLSIHLPVEDEELTSITLGISNAHEWLSQIPYDLSDVFSSYGEPDDIFLLISGPPIGFALVIPYNEQGFMLRYSAIYNDSEFASNNEYLPICLHPEIIGLEQIDVWLQNADEVSTIESNQSDLYDDREIRPWWNIQRMANVTVTEFVDFFMSNPQQCFPIPSLAELREQGYVP